MKTGRIYKVVDNTNGKFYIGSTTTSLSQRLALHKCHAKNIEKKDTRCRDIINNGDFRIECIEEIEFENSSQLREKERNCILKCREESPDLIVNKCVPTTITVLDKSKYQQDYSKQYRKSNKEYFREHHKKWREENSDYYKEYRMKNKDKQKEYMKKYMKNYRLKKKLESEKLTIGENIISDNNIDEKL